MPLPMPPEPTYAVTVAPPVTANSAVTAAPAPPFPAVEEPPPPAPLTTARAVTHHASTVHAFPARGLTAVKVCGPSRRGWTLAFAEREPEYASRDGGRWRIGAAAARDGSERALIESREDGVEGAEESKSAPASEAAASVPATPTRPHATRRSSASALMASGR